MFDRDIQITVCRLEDQPRGATVFEEKLVPVAACLLMFHDGDVSINVSLDPDVFLTQLLSWNAEVKPKIALEEDPGYKLTPAQELIFAAKTECDYCKRSFESRRENRLHDHKVSLHNELCDNTLQATL